MQHFLTVRDVARHLKVGVRTVWRWTAAGAMPPPVRTGVNGRVVRWRARDIHSFLNRPARKTRMRDDR
jgi:excisionase family DNA binding protein